MQTHIQSTPSFKTTVNVIRAMVMNLGIQVTHKKVAYHLTRIDQGIDHYDASFRGWVTKFTTGCIDFRKWQKMPHRHLNREFNLRNHLTRRERTDFGLHLEDQSDKAEIAVLTFGWNMKIAARRGEIYGPFLVAA